MPIVIPPSSQATSAPQVLATQQVFDYVVDPTGKAIVNTKVTATLNFAGASDITPIVNITPVTQVTLTDSNGYFTFNLVPNTNITPAGTLYTISTNSQNYDIFVPATNGPFQSSQILANAPAVLSPAITGLIGPITVTGNESVSGNLTVAGVTTLASTTTGALTTTAAAGIAGDLTVQSPGRLLLTALVSKIISGATSLSIRDNADANDNFLISNAGAATLRSGLTITAGGLIVTAGGQTISAGDLILTAGRILINSAAAKVLGGATSLSLRNHADNADNVLVTDAGLITLRNALSLPPSAAGTVAASNYGSIPIKITETVLGSATASITFSSIPSGFSHLLLLAQVINDTGSVGGCMRANGDTGTNYNRAELDQIGTSQSIFGAGAAATATPDFYSVAGSLNTTTESGVIYIPNYTRTTLAKNAVSICGGVYSASNPAIRMKSWNWNQTSAITSLTFFPFSNNFGIGTVFSLYGVP